MIVVSKTFSLPQFYDFSHIAPLKDIVFLDIETTGFSPNSSGLYLIGIAYHQQMEWHTRQWFADSLQAEQEIIKDFLAFLQDFRVIVTFNGDGFDLPYLKKCADQYAISFDIEGHTSFDLYKRMRPLRRLLNLENMKLNTLEAFLHIERGDKTSGKDMIPVYKQFLETREEALYQTVLLHSEEDLKTLPQLMPLFGYLDIFHCDWNMAGYSLNAEEKHLTTVIDCNVSVPVAFAYQTTMYTLSIRGNQIIVEMPVFEGELKYFFDHYEEYDYLPEEDMAIHHKVAQFADKTHRVKATARTCYTRKKGIFVPMVQKKDTMFDIFRDSYDSDEYYTEYHDDPDFLLSYFRLLLSGEE